jgi:hypothetical protein
MNDVIEMQPREMPVAIQSTSDSQTMMRMIEVAMSRPDFDIDKLQRLLDVKEQWEKNEARKAYVEAMAEFKKDPPEIFKDKTVSFRTDKGQTTYDHATIGNVVEKIVGALAKYGFSHRWVPNRAEGGMISITCVITHKLGHSEETTLEAGLDQSGGKNNIQAMISTKTYLERHSLLAATGLATKDQEDDDGHGSSASPSDACALMIQEALATKTDAEALAYWRENNGKIAKDKKNHARLKQVVLDHRAKLQSEATKPTDPQDRDIASLTADMDAAADEGLDAFTRAWDGLSKESQAKLADEFDRFKVKATKKGAKK